MSKNIKNPHDKYFSAVFSYKSIAIDFLKAFLPIEYREKLDLDSLERVTGSFIDKNLQEYFADMIYRCKLKGSDEEIWISLLLEHKSYDDKDTDFQILSYIDNGWQQDVKQGRKRRFILPIVLYHGITKWKKKKIIDHFEQIGEHFMPFLPKFEYILIDLSKFSEKDLLSMQLDAMIINLAMILKFGRDETYVINHINRIFYKSQEYFDIATGKNFFEISFVYLLELVDAPSTKWKAILKKLPKPVKKSAMTLYDSIRQEAMQEGIQKGMQEGIQKGMQEGIQKGMQEGIQKGMQEGIQKGVQDAQQHTLKIIQLLKNQVPAQKIAEKLEIDLDFVLKIKEQLLQ